MIVKKSWRIGSLLLLLNLFIILNSLFLLLGPHYATDTWIEEMVGHDPRTPLSSGRPVWAVALYLLKRIGFPPIAHRTFFTFLFMVTAASCAVLLTMAFVHDRKHSALQMLLINGSCLLGVHNVFILEWYLFPEAMGMYALCLAGSVGAAIFAAHAHRPLEWLAAFALLFIGINSYQAGLGIFASCAIFLIAAYPSRCSLLRIAGILLLAGSVSVLNPLLTNLSITVGMIPPSSRGIDLSALSGNITYVAKQVSELWSSDYHLMPAPLLIFTLLLAVAALLYTCVHSRDLRSRGTILIAPLIGLCAVFAPHLISSEHWMSARSIAGVFIPCAGAFALLSLCLQMKSLQLLLGSLICTLVLTQSACMQQITLEHLKLNMADIQYARQIGTVLRERETQTGILIRRIAMCEDADPQGHSIMVRRRWMNVNESAFGPDWSKIAILNQVNWGDWVLTDMPEHVMASFSGRNWDYFNPDEQIVVENDTAYIVLY